MRVLLQHKNSGFYVKPDGEWTDNAAEAKDFLSSTLGIHYCQDHKLTSVQLVLKFDKQHYDIVLQMARTAHPRSDARR